MKSSAESIRAMRPANQPGEGGSIPASALYFHAGRMKDVSTLILLFHYSKRVPTNIQAVGSLHLAGGLFGDCGECVCGCVFTVPPTRWSEPVWELSRLVRKDGIRVPLTLLIRLTVAQVKRTGLIDLLVSFADETQKHHGGIYQAAGWNYDGKRERRMDGVVHEGEFIGGRATNHRWGTSSPSKLAGLGVEVEPHYDEGKHLYWKALNRDGEAKAKRLGLKSLAYPKPRRSEN